MFPILPMVFRVDAEVAARRDTSSRLNSMVGGRLVPGEHHHAHFDVSETEDRLRVRFESDDGGREIATAGDGFLATFDGQARAVRCGQAIAQARMPGSTS